MCVGLGCVVPVIEGPRNLSRVYWYLGLMEVGNGAFGSRSTCQELLSGCKGLMGFLIHNLSRGRGLVGCEFR
jgi:hypothetical protein